MKHQFPLIITGAMSSALFATTAILIGGCNSTESTGADAADTTTGSASVAKATPPPNLDIKALEAQQSAAQKAVEEMNKKAESGQK